jgi:hypothetical protein
MLADATMTVREARQRLSDTRGLSREAIEEAERVVRAFFDKHPRHKGCIACGCARWSEHRTQSGDAVWCCANCHRSSDLTQQEWFALQAPARAKEAKKSAAIERLVASEWEGLIATALETRATYLGTIAALGWVIRNGAAPHGDTRGARLVQESDVAPSRWQEAATLAASGGVMAARLAQLEAK